MCWYIPKDLLKLLKSFFAKKVISPFLRSIYSELFDAQTISKKNWKTKFLRTIFCFFLLFLCLGFAHNFGCIGEVVKDREKFISSLPKNSKFVQNKNLGYHCMYIHTQPRFWFKLFQKNYFSIYLFFHAHGCKAY
jgi:hypothetical protein